MVDRNLTLPDIIEIQLTLNVPFDQAKYLARIVKLAIVQADVYRPNDDWVTTLQ